MIGAALVSLALALGGSVDRGEACFEVARAAEGARGPAAFRSALLECECPAGGAACEREVMVSYMTDVAAENDPVAASGSVDRCEATASAAYDASGGSDDVYEDAFADCMGVR